MLKPETINWLKIGWNELFHRFDAYGPYMLCGLGFVVVFFLIVVLPYLLFDYLLELSIAWWVWLFLLFLGIALSLIVSIRIAYILYIGGSQ